MTGAVPMLNASAILQAYQSVDGSGAAQGTAGGAAGPPGAPTGGDAFSNLLGRALDGAIATGHQADAQAMQAVSGHGDLTQVVTAVSQAELALQTTVAVRDRVLQAYQDIIKMPI
jgi:flagellar hook-basal body complex protein FliE